MRFQGIESTAKASSQITHVPRRNHLGGVEIGFRYGLDGVETAAAKPHPPFSLGWDGFRPRRAPIPMEPNIVDGYGWGEALR